MPPLRQFFFNATKLQKITELRKSKKERIIKKIRRARTVTTQTGDQGQGGQGDNKIQHAHKSIITTYTKHNTSILYMIDSFLLSLIWSNAILVVWSII